MSAYRDELEALRHRAGVLEEELTQREAELQELYRSHEAGPTEPQKAVRRRARERLLAVGLAGAALMIPAAAIVLGSRAHGTRGPAWPVDSAPPWTSGRIVSNGGRGTGLPKPPAGDVRPSKCAPKHGYDGPARFPVGARVLDFSQCVGCACCLAGGNFPRQFSDEPQPKPLPEYYECGKCAAEQVLGRAGVTLGGVRGGGAGHFSVEYYVANVTLDAPVVALGLWAGVSGVSTKVKPEHQRSVVVTLVGYDDAGRPIDKESASIPTWAEDPDHIDFQAYRAFLAVESCAGVTLRRAELYVSDLNMYLEGITLALAHDS